MVVVITLYLYQRIAQHQISFFLSSFVHSFIQPSTQPLRYPSGMLEYKAKPGRQHRHDSDHFDESSSQAGFLPSLVPFKVDLDEVCAGLGSPSLARQQVKEVSEAQTWHSVRSARNWSFKKALVIAFRTWSFKVGPDLTTIEIRFMADVARAA